MKYSDAILDEMQLKIISLTEYSSAGINAPFILKEGRKSAKFFNVLSKLIRESISEDTTVRTTLRFQTYADGVISGVKDHDFLQSKEFLDDNMTGCEVHELVQKDKNYRTLQATILDGDTDLQEYLNALKSGTFTLEIRFDFYETSSNGYIAVHAPFSHLIIIGENPIQKDLTSFRYSLARSRSKEAIAHLLEEGVETASTLIHELGHSYDLFRAWYKNNSSEPLKAAKKLSSSYFAKSLDPSSKEYLNYYITRKEIQARIHQAFDDLVMRHIEESPDKFLNLAEIDPSFRRSIAIHFANKVLDWIPDNMRNEELKRYLYKMSTQMLNHEFSRIKKSSKKLNLEL